MRVAEVFGSTIQGEGPSAGQLCAFIRLSGCNLNCAWCDTPYTWDWTGQNGRAYLPVEESHNASAAQLVEQIKAMSVPLVVITGGEPLAQRQGCMDLAMDLVESGHRVEIETNGTLAPHLILRGTEQVRFNVSPKLANSGIPEAKRISPGALHTLAKTGRAIFKFVVTSPEDLDEVGKLVTTVALDPGLVWLMPECRSAEQHHVRFPWVAQAAIDHGYNASARLHVLAWGDERGH